MQEIVLNVPLEYHHVMLDQLSNVMLNLFQMEESALVNLDMPQLLMELLVELAQLIVIHVHHHHNVLHVKQDSPYNQVDHVHLSVNQDNMSLIPLQHQLLPIHHHHHLVLQVVLLAPLL